MKIYDCFMYFDEDMVLDLRLNTLNDFVDYFVIVESKFTHKGDSRKLKFDIKKFEKFRNKIIYLVFEKEPSELFEITDHKNDHGGYIMNALLRENGQRNFILEGLRSANVDDFILISDVDEIPNLENIDLSKFKEKIIQFRQEMFYYKFNLKLPNLIWTGTKGCKKKYLIAPQWLRNIKDKKYAFYRIDTIFSKTKYISTKLIDNGGWHFSNIKSAKEIEYKLKSYLHHREFDINPLKTEEIENIINNKKAIYDLKVDKRVNKIGNGSKLENYPTNKLPLYLQNNKKKYEQWID
jgi:beta-1,4-mannosyl-glycoprotein beta-1,4-N-acetylglucosaminyltransferase